MKPNNRRQPVASVNITPLVDVLLILLVVVLLAMPMYVKRLPVELPSTSISGTPTPVSTLEVALTKNGNLLLKNNPVDPPTLKRLITSNTTVELSIDKEVKYASIASLIADIQSQSPKEVVLLTH